MSASGTQFYSEEMEGRFHSNWTTAPARHASATHPSNKPTDLSWIALVLFLVLLVLAVGCIVARLKLAEKQLSTSPSSAYSSTVFKFDEEMESQLSIHSEIYLGLTATRHCDRHRKKNKWNIYNSSLAQKRAKKAARDRQMVDDCPTQTTKTLGSVDRQYTLEEDQHPTGRTSPPLYSSTGSTAFTSKDSPIITRGSAVSTSTANTTAEKCECDKRRKSEDKTALPNSLKVMVDVQSMLAKYPQETMPGQTLENEMPFQRPVQKIKSKSCSEKIVYDQKEIPV